MKDYLLATMLGAMLVIILSGCASHPTVTEVRVPVQVSCITAPPVPPKLYTDAELKQLDDYHLALALLLDRIKAANYQAELEAAVEACK